MFSKKYAELMQALAGEQEIVPASIAAIFDKYINQKEFGAYYTRAELTQYLCARAIDAAILGKAVSLNLLAISKFGEQAFFHPSTMLENALQEHDPVLLHQLWHHILPNLTILDPACGAGAFLSAALQCLLHRYMLVLQQIQTYGTSIDRQSIKEWKATHPDLRYSLGKQILLRNLFGVDIMSEAVEVTRLRLCLALDQLSEKPCSITKLLPILDFNIMTGNALVGITFLGTEQVRSNCEPKNQEKKNKHTQPQTTNSEILSYNIYQDLVRQKQGLIASYRQENHSSEELLALHQQITKIKETAGPYLDEVLLNEFMQCKIQFEEATWDSQAQKMGKPQKKTLDLQQIAHLQPFHWAYEFSEILGTSDGDTNSGAIPRPGFAVIITNPPWEIWKPQSKEFFAKYSDVVHKNKMTVLEFDKHQARALQNPEIRAAWLEYCSKFPYVSLYFRRSPQYQYQNSKIHGKKTGSDVNLYKVFLERCFHLLQPGGQCGIIIPSGIYTDLGCLGLRRMLFEQTQITGLVGFENRRGIFENVHKSFKFGLLTFTKTGKIFENVDSRFKFGLLTFTKGKPTQKFPVSFMRYDLSDLSLFPCQDAIWLTVDLIQKMAPGSLSLMEFRNSLDVAIAEKMLQFPLLGQTLPSSWNVQFTAELHMTHDSDLFQPCPESMTRPWNVQFIRELDMTNDSDLFQTMPQLSLLPLYEGKMIWQFQHNLALPRYWIDEKQGRARMLGRATDQGKIMNYQTYRLGFRNVASNTNERTLISTIVPHHTFCGNNIPVLQIFDSSGQPRIQAQHQLFLCAIFNSFVLDYFLRQKVTCNINFFYLYQLPIPRLMPQDPIFKAIVERCASLICTSPEYIPLANQLGFTTLPGVLDPSIRLQTRAGLDSLIAKLYGITQKEFAHILSTFPLVSKNIRDITLQAYDCHI